jgi:hypothetical protein
LVNILAEAVVFGQLSQLIDINRGGCVKLPTLVKH